MGRRKAEALEGIKGMLTEAVSWVVLTADDQGDINYAIYAPAERANYMCDVMKKTVMSWETV